MHAHILCTHAHTLALQFLLCCFTSFRAVRFHCCSSKQVSRITLRCSANVYLDIEVLMQYVRDRSVSAGFSGSISPCAIFFIDIGVQSGSMHTSLEHTSNVRVLTSFEGKSCLERCEHGVHSSTLHLSTSFEVNLWFERCVHGVHTSNIRAFTAFESMCGLHDVKTRMFEVCTPCTHRSSQTLPSNEVET